MKKDEKTMKSQFEHMMKLQEKCKELKAQALGQVPASSSLGVPGVKAKGALGPPATADEKEKLIFEIQDKLTQAEKNKEIMQQAKES